LPEVHNPNLQSQGSGSGGGGGDMRSTMAMMLVVLAAFFGYQYFFAKPKPDQQPPVTSQSQPAPPSASVPQATPGPGSGPAPASPAAAPVPGAPPQVAAPIETVTTVENELFKIQFTNRGAQVQHWILKKYTDSQGKPLDLVQPQAAANVQALPKSGDAAKGRAEGAEQCAFPLAFFVDADQDHKDEQNVATTLNQSLYQVTVSGAQPTATGLVVAPASISFHYAANGLDAVKTFRFDSSYVIGVEAQVKQNGAPVRALVAWPAGLGDMEELRASAGGSLIPSGQRPTPSFFAWSIDGKEDSLAAAKVSGNNTIDQPYQYAAVMDLYFASAFMPDSPENTTVVTLHSAIELPSDPSDPNSRKTHIDVLGLAVGDTTGDTRLRLFAGPKATDVLKSVNTTGADGKSDGPALSSLIQYGWMTVIAKPLYLALRFMLRIGIPNWGWAIIAFTALFNLALLPTRLMMTKSSLKMMRIQPKVDAIKKRYANLKMNDPKRNEMNAEMMALYKTEGVNMYGSCLPMLLQMPFFFAYFRVLQNAVELRQAHWFWLPDLSQPDPTHVLPIFVIITMFLTQYITPSPGMDPAQRRMMAFMTPMIFGFILWRYPSGLALYWGTGNIIMLTMQILINRSHWGKEMHAIAARRAEKKLGSNSKTVQGRR
jgi:YidC/Oxa1 family membrane protein insertase